MDASNTAVEIRGPLITRGRAQHNTDAYANIAQAAPAQACGAGTLHYRGLRQVFHELSGWKHEVRQGGCQVSTRFVHIADVQGICTQRKSSESEGGRTSALAPNPLIFFLCR